MVAHVSTVLTVEAGPWEFGWEALVAIGTIGLAAFTAWLAFTTRRVAKSTRDEVASAWRPVVVVTRAELLREPDEEEWSLRLVVLNVGSGAALELRVQYEELDDGERVSGVQIGVLPQGQPDEIALEPRSTDPTTLQVWMDYVDNAGRKYATALNLAARPEVSDQTIVVANIRVYEDMHLIRQDVEQKIRETYTGLRDLPAARGGL